MTPERLVFEEALGEWQSAASTAANARRSYERALGAALLKADAKNAEARKAQAEAACVPERALADQAEIEARAAYHRMIFLRGGPLVGREERS